MLVITNVSGSMLFEQRYLPFGGERADLGNISQTDFGYTGQRDLGIGLSDYKARFYDPALGRFIQPDTIVPIVFAPQNLNRFSYVLNNSIVHSDPTGHRCQDGDENIWGYCGDKLPAPSQVKEKDKLSYITDVAIKYNIEIPNQDRWAYYPYPFSDVDLGFIAWRDQRLPDGNPVSDKFVYITRSAFFDPRYTDSDLKITSELEFASLLVHEAEHAWQRFYDKMGIFNKYPEKFDGIGNLTSGFRAVTEGDAYITQSIWLQNHGVSSGKFYEQVESRAEDNISHANDLNMVFDGQPYHYTFPLPIYNIAK